MAELVNVFRDNDPITIRATNDERNSEVFRLEDKSGNTLFSRRNFTNTSDIQAAITAGGDVYIPPGTYNLTETLLVPSNTRIFAPGVTFKRTTDKYMLQFAASSTNIHIFGLTLDANDGALGTHVQREVCIYHSAGSNYTFEECRWINSQGFAVQIWGNSGTTARPTGLRLINCNFQQIAGANADFVVVVGDKPVVDGCIINGTGTGQILNIYECDEPSVTNTTVTGTGAGALFNISSCKNATVTNSHAICGSDDVAFYVMKETDNGDARACTDTVINGCTARSLGGTPYPLKVQSASRTILSNCVFTGPFTFIVWTDDTSGTPDGIFIHGNVYQNAGASSVLHTVGTPATNLFYRDNRPFGTTPALPDS